jgi:hypothetical protein
MHHMLGGTADPTQVGSMVEIADLARGAVSYLGSDPRVINTGSDPELHINFRDPTTRPKADSGSDIEALITNLRGWKTVTKANLFGNTLTGTWHRCSTRLVVRIESATGASWRSGDTELDLKVDRDNGIYGAAGSRVSTWDRPGDSPVNNIFQTVPEADPSPALLLRIGFDAGTAVCDDKPAGLSCSLSGGTAPVFPGSGDAPHGANYIRFSGTDTDLVVSKQLANELAVRTGTGLSAAFTFMFRVRLGTDWYSSCPAAAVMSVFGGGGFGGGPHFRIAIRNGKFAFSHDQTHKVHEAQADAFGVAPPENQWLQVSVVADRGAHEQSVIRVRQATGAGQPFLFTSRGVVPIRNDGTTGNTNSFLQAICSAATMDIDDVRVYAAALTEKQITDIHDSTS